MTWLIRLQKELEAEIAEINPAVALLLFVWRRCSPACTKPAAAIILDRFLAPCCLASHSLGFCVCSFWFRFVRLWQTVRVTPLETYRAVSITSSAAKDVVTDMVSDSVQQARHAVEEARAVAERSRAKAELMEDRPCPDVRLSVHLCAHCLQSRKEQACQTCSIVLACSVR